MTAVLPKIKNIKVNLSYFGNKSTILELEADNPDDACYLAYMEFCDYIMRQDDSSETKKILKEIKNDFRVISLIEL